MRLFLRQFEGRIYTCLILLLAAFIPVLAASFFSLRELIREEKEVLDLRARQTVLTERLNTDFERQLSLMPVFVLTVQPDLLEVLQTARQSMHDTIKSLASLTQDPEEVRSLYAINDAETRHNEIGQTGVRMRQGGASIQRMNRYFSEIAGPATNTLRREIEAYSLRKAQQLEEARAELSRSARRAEIGMALISAITLLFLTLVMSLIVRELRRKRDADQALTRMIERERQISQQRKDNVDVVSHDLKNPIAALKLRLQILARRSGADPALERDMRLAMQSVQSMESLVRDLLDHAKMEAGKLELSKRACGMSAIVEDTLARLGPLAQEKGIRLELQIDPGLPTLVCDPARISQVLDNLLGNALKFSPKGGTVRISARHRDQLALLEVSDSGPGIAPENLALVFDRFWQDARTAQKGNGLGLAIARKIVEAHGGKIWAESRPGEGAQFFFTLPAELFVSPAPKREAPSAQL